MEECLNRGCGPILLGCGRTGGPGVAPANQRSARGIGVSTPSERCGPGRTRFSSTGFGVVDIWKDV